MGGQTAVGKDHVVWFADIQTRLRSFRFSQHEAVTKVAQHAVMEARLVQVHGQGVIEIDAAAQGLGGLPVGQIEQELQHEDRGQLSRRETGASITYDRFADQAVSVAK